MTTTVVVVDIGTSNVGSVANMLRKVGAEAEVTADPEVVQAAERLVLPGVGAFDEAMANLDRTGLTDALRHSVIDRGVPVLGICLGLQLLADSSEEGERSGLGFVPGRVVRLRADGVNGALPVPHMGWNRVRSTRATPLEPEASTDPRYYFVHTYAIVPADPSDVLFTTTYGDEFVSGVQRGDITAVQFHPEKSHRHGRALLSAWLER